MSLLWRRAIKMNLANEGLEKAKEEAEKNAKKRKAQSNIPSAVEFEEDDDVYYGGKGKRAKAKGGIGYAGDIREDVRKFMFILLVLPTQLLISL